LWHEGVRVTHPRIHAALLRGVRFLEEEGVFVTALRHFRAQIDVEDTPFFVGAWDGETGELELSDGSREPLDPATLSLDPDDALRCRVKGGRWPARFTHAAQAHLLDRLEPCEGRAGVRIGADWRPAPGLDPLA